MRPRPLLLAAGALAMVGTGEHGARVVPANATRPPGTSRADDPAIGPAQEFRIVEDVASDTLRRVARTPFVAAARSGHRLAERLAVRAVELTPGAMAACEPFEWGCGLDGGFGGPARPARLTLLTDSRAAIDGLLALIAGARTRVDLMMYGWQDDPTGRLVADALAARAGQGVRVRLLVDKASNVIHNPGAVRGGPPFLDRLACTPNVTLVLAPDAGARFDHRKLAVADDRLAWSGSMILTDSALHRWRNYSYLAEGPIVADLAAVFAHRWQEVGRPAAPPLAGPADLALPGPPDAIVRRIGTDVDGERSLAETVYHAVDHARHHIYLSNPYFSDEILVAKLIAARRRGVDVRAVLTLRGNIERMNRFSALNANRLLRGGCRVYLYPTMTHVKAMSADGAWAYVGTGNFDELSLRNNREVGLSIAGPGAVAAIDRTLFLRDMADSEERLALLPMPRGRLMLEAFALWY